jgi:uncharacterized protein YjbI with pentapeptide repeats
MSDLLLNKNLRESKPEDEVRNVARALTLTTLGQLNDTRKGELVRFLQESNLINIKNVIIRLDDADLRGADLHDSQLFSANFYRANLIGANFDNARLDGANFFDANLSSANLRGSIASSACFQNANLSHANLSGANLSGGNIYDAVINNDAIIATCPPIRASDHLGANFLAANLSEANLSGAYLPGTYFRGANLRGADLRGAAFGMYATRDSRSFYLFRNTALGAINFYGADLIDADFSYADLYGAANVTPEQLAKVGSLKGAIMPNGSRHL